MEETDSESEQYLKESRTPYGKMFSKGILLTLPCVIAGIVDGYSAVAIQQMHLDINEASWFGSAPNFVSPVGGVLLCLIIDAYGRKFAILVAMVPYFFGWLFLFMDLNLYISILGRILTGLPTGNIFYPIQVYTTECIAVNNDRLRSSFASWSSLTNTLGIFLVFLLNPFINYRQISTVAFILSAIFIFIIYVIIPESPTWLYLKGKLKDAEASQRKLGIFQPILHNSTSCPSSSINSEIKKNSTFISFHEVLKKLTRPDVRKSLIVTTIMITIAIHTGGNTLLVYKMIDIVPAKLEEKGAYFDIISGGIVFGSRVFASLVLPLFGAKKLVILASFALCVGYAAVGYISLANETLEKIIYINMAGVWLASFAFYGGVVLVPYTILSEMFPPDAKGFAIFPILSASIMTAIVVKLYPYLYLYLGGYLYFIYLFVTVVYAIFVCYFAPSMPKMNAEKGINQRTLFIDE